ncbi:MAG TPA: hypothetical protein PK440_12770 [Candidatus Accumulibacter phosphatis]|nr:MAG: hypothetical protein AW07_02029 [Candidatus Accumulibacter sp. SK-11]HAY29259.1 hypothetical protein [Accumulibacter sp.]HCN69124.1 hypothetical protein [Accumulibacter sp.]HRL76450.1 hypothetical protein [Candidatus Accumulibacter phosphatis]HRQ95852.1 hypothetical protein [Candidatus Accumulibacter phosphatis]
MIFQPAIIALLLSSLLCIGLLLAAAPFAVDLIRHWDLGSGSERQLLRERRTYLLSTLLAFVFATQLLALLLFVFNADRMASLFVGAMCAVGTLQVNAFGFPALLAQILVFFLAAVWLVINHVDTRAPDYPLLRIKYVLLLCLLPVLLAAALLQWRYFLALKADVITSCCGSLFSDAAPGITADLAAAPPLPTMLAFYLSLALAGGGALLYRRWQRGGYLVALLSALAFAVTMAAVLAFISLYVYEHPHHHCPFCILKPEYGYQGYALYGPLFIGTAAGLGVGAVQAFASVPSLRSVVPAVAGRLAGLSAGMFLAVAVVASLIVINSRLLLLAT